MIIVHFSKTRLSTICKCDATYHCVSDGKMDFANGRNLHEKSVELSSIVLLFVGMYFGDVHNSFARIYFRSFANVQ